MYFPGSCLYSAVLGACPLHYCTTLYYGITKRWQLFIDDVIPCQVSKANDQARLYFNIKLSIVSCLAYEWQPRGSEFIIINKFEEDAFSRKYLLWPLLDCYYYSLNTMTRWHTPRSTMDFCWILLMWLLYSYIYMYLTLFVCYIITMVSPVRLERFVLVPTIYCLMQNFYTLSSNWVARLVCHESDALRVD